MIELDKFEGHIILYCKNHYRQEGVDFIEGLQRIWAVRCGYGVECIDKSVLEYIANAMYKLVRKVNPQKIEYLFEIIHREISKKYIGHREELSPIEKLIMIYRDELAFTEVKKKVTAKKYETLIKLPKPQKRVFKRILNGKSKKEDYKLIS